MCKFLLLYIGTASRCIIFFIREKVKGVNIEEVRS